jgi:uncharacterized coiled-coil protein SlyX
VKHAAWFLMLVLTTTLCLAQSAPKKRAKAPPKPTTTQLQEQLAAQQARISELEAMLAAQTQRIEELQASLAQAQTDSGEAEAAKAAQAAELQVMKDQMAALAKQLEDLRAAIPGMLAQQDLAKRLEAVEAATEKVPELPKTIVSAGDFPGSIRIPGTDTAIKFGGRIRAAAIFTLGPLGSEDRFLTNSIPVEADDEAAGKGRRTTFSANTSRFNFEVRTPVGENYMRAFIEGDFFGNTAIDTRTAFRLRHAFAQYRGFLFGQTWSTFSDPAANHQDMDFEGINGENVIRQAQVRYAWKRGKTDLAVAAETPQVSITGGQGVNQIPDLVGRAIWPVKDIGHFQVAGVLRQIRGQWTLDPTVTRSSFAWGATASGVVPFHYFKLTDRLIFQLNVGEGNARYINDLNSLGGQDAVFDDATGALGPLPATGGYIDFEHQWTQWETTRVMKLRSSFIWSYVAVDNLGFQPPDAYRRTNRFSVNLVFSPIDRIDMGVEYIYGSRENKNGLRGTSDQFQVVGIFRF